MTDRPIIFSAPMVRALLAGRKTQTRRIIRDAVPEAPGMDQVHPKNQVRHAAPYLDAYCGQPRTPANPRGMSDRWCWWTRDDRCGVQFKVGYQPGDRLWVRESLALKEDGGVQWATYAADGAWVKSGIVRIDPRKIGNKPRPSIHMPRWASRLTLSVTEVRVERLQAISDEDVRAEGALRPATNLEIGQDGYWAGKPSEARFVLTRREAFALLWNSINGAGAWDANPWVVAVSFDVTLSNIDRMPERPAPVAVPSAAE